MAGTADSGSSICSEVGDDGDTIGGALYLDLEAAWARSC
jgi:hypothetical protein